MEKIDVVFMGTPEFAVTILDKLVDDSAIHIKGVITATDKPAGRGRSMHSSAVKEYALKNNLTILQPTNLKDPAFAEELRNLNADLFVVVAFRMLPEVIWSMPRLGTINLHASLLPQYRGAAPINWAIINGETETGVTTFFIEKEIDTGAIIEQRKVSIAENATVGELYEQLMNLGADTTRSTIHAIMSGNVIGINQEQNSASLELKSAPKIFKDDCKINFAQELNHIHNFCRGLDPYPGAWFRIYNKIKEEIKTVKIFNVEKTQTKVSNHSDFSTSEFGILIPCSDYYLLVKEIQIEGKRKMGFKEFLIGHDISNFHLEK